jgi:hypothetical protein
MCGYECMFQGTACAAQLSKAYLKWYSRWMPDECSAAATGSWLLAAYVWLDGNRYWNGRVAVVKWHSTTFDAELVAANM